MPPLSAATMDVDAATISKSDSSSDSSKAAESLVMKSLSASLSCSKSTLLWKGRAGSCSFLRYSDASRSLLLKESLTLGFGCRPSVAKVIDYLPRMDPFHSVALLSPSGATGKPYRSPRKFRSVRTPTKVAIE